MRIERDALGTKQVPDEAYYGIHTTRSMENFGAAGERLPLELVYAMVVLKRACATANEELGLIDADKAEAIRNACGLVLAGGFDDQFPVDVFQAGSGTSSNMNVNEVLANVACELLGGVKGDRSLVHPNDHVNRGQSTNNVFPSAIRVAMVDRTEALLEALDTLVDALRDREMAFADTIKSGRTHLQDAVPVTLGQEFGAYASAVARSADRVRGARTLMYDLGVGGNAVGTGVNTPESFRRRVIEALNADAGEASRADEDGGASRVAEDGGASRVAEDGGPFRVAEDGLAATQFLTDFADLSGSFRAVALDLLKVSNDLRLLSSGPRTGLAEIRLPAVEPGSSIMPGKINPSICEAVAMACYQVVGLDAATASACGAGQLELNTHMPLVGANLVKASAILERASRMFAERCVRGIEADRERCRTYFESSAGLATILNPLLGYDRVSELVKESLVTGISLREMVLENGLLDEAAFDELLRRSTGPTPGS